MSIVPLNKVTFYGSTAQCERVIDRLQDLGCAHLRNLADPDRGEQADEGRDTAAHEALKFLRSCRQHRRQVRRERFDRRAVVQEALGIQARQQELLDERDALRKAIDDLEPWGDFELPAGGRIAGQRVWFFVIPLRDLKQFYAQPPAAWHEVTRDHREARLVVIQAEEPRGLPGTRVELDGRSLSRLRAAVEEAEEELAALHYQRIGLTRFCELLAGELARADDAAARARAARLTLRRDRVFALQCWAPADQTNVLRALAERYRLAVTFEPPAADDEPPTLLENPPSLRGGQACVSFYKTPGYGSWDPSVVVFFSFAAFFAMILADAGYAAVGGLLLLVGWSRLSASPAARSLRGLLLTIVLMSLAYGLLANSVFGLALPVLEPVQVIDVESAARMMPLTIALGVGHLLLANLVIAWRRRREPQALAAAGWAAVLLGGALAAEGLLVPIDDPALAASLAAGGEVVFAGGLVAVLAFSSPRRLATWNPRTHLLRLVDGLTALARLANLFGDVLSYLRLFALGLASARLAATFNEIGVASWEAGGLGVVLALVVVLGGHTLNLLLSLMSGVVHGLRLNCIEFFNWSLPDEGSPFQPFAKKAVPG